MNALYPQHPDIYRSSAREYAERLIAGRRVAINPITQRPYVGVSHAYSDNLSIAPASLSLFDLD